MCTMDHAWSNVKEFELPHYTFCINLWFHMSIYCNLAWSLQFHVPFSKIQTIWKFQHILYEKNKKKNKTMQTKIKTNKTVMNTWKESNEHMERILTSNRPAQTLYTWKLFSTIESWYIKLGSTNKEFSDNWYVVLETILVRIV